MELIFDLGRFIAEYDLKLSKNQHLPYFFEDEPLKRDLLDRYFLGLSNLKLSFWETQHSDMDYLN